MPEVPGLVESRRAASFWSWTAGLSLAVAVVSLVWITACVMGTREITWDDNYISYIYSRNLAQGHGLRYNAADPAPTEGVSSLSHVLLVALTDRLGVDPLAASRGASLLFFVLIPLLVGLPLARLLEMSAVTALAVCYAGQILYFLSVDSLYNLVLGMETIIFMGGLAALAGWSIGEFDLGGATPRSPLWRTVSGCLATILVVFGRPEGPFLVVLTLGIVFLANRMLFPGRVRRTDRSFLAVAAFAALLIAAYFLWKLTYFGFLLPNPYYVKSQGASMGGRLYSFYSFYVESHRAIMGAKNTWLPGWRFTKTFLGLIWPWMAAGIPLFLLSGGSRAARKALLAAAIPGAVMVLAYAKAIHEMAFWHRYEFPYLVYLHLLLAGLACLAAKRLRVLPLVVVATAVLWVTSLPVDKMPLRKNPLTFLKVQVGLSKNVLVQIGKDLARTGLGQRATIALGAAGAIPYFSGFRAIDEAGLNNNYLSGRTAHTVAEVWGYIDSFKPDVILSTSPPATPGVPVDQDDPVLGAPAFAPFFRGEFDSEAPQFTVRGKFMESMRREMILLRDHYTFGAAYAGDSGWLFLYVRRDSPYRTSIQQVLQASFATDRKTDLRAVFINDPRRLGETM